MKRLLAIIVILACLPAFGAQRYVATTGNDSNSGTQIRPWKTISKAFRSVNPGDTVTVTGGTYTERPVLQRSGTASAPITFRASGAVTVNGGAKGDNCKFIVFNGFKNTVPLLASNDSEDRGTGWLLNDIQNCTFINCTVSHTMRTGICLNAYTVDANCNNKFIGCKIEYAGPYASAWVAGTGNVFDGCEFALTCQNPLYPTLSTASGADSDGVIVKNARNTIIRNCTFRDIGVGSGNVSNSSDCVNTYWLCDGLEISHCTFMAPMDSGRYQIGMIGNDRDGGVRNINIHDCTWTGYRGPNFGGFAWGVSNQPRHAITGVSIINNTGTNTDYNVELRNCPGAVTSGNTWKEGRGVNVEP